MTGNFAEFISSFINLLRPAADPADQELSLSDDPSNPVAPNTKDLEVHCNFAVESPQSFPVGLSTGHRVLFGVKVEKYE